MSTASCSPDWTMLFTDSPSSETVAGRAPSNATHVLYHPSGRVWIIARAHFGVLTSTEGRNRAVALIGAGPVPAPALDAALRSSHSPRGVDAALSALPGVFLVAIRTGRQQVIRGPATGLRRWFSRQFPGPDGPFVVADRASLLGGPNPGNASVDIDHDVVAMRLLEPVPHPLNLLTPWRGVHALFPHDRYVLDAGQRARIERWWSPPTSSGELPVTEGAGAVRDALLASSEVHLRRDAGAVSADLSGGLDSAAVTALAIATDPGRPIITVTARSKDPLDDDGAWAQVLTDGFGGAIDPRELPAGDLPVVYDGLTDPLSGSLDEPSIASCYLPRLAAVISRAATCGSRTHLTGHGGDQLFSGLPGLCAERIASHPWQVAATWRDYRSLFAWRAGPMLSQLVRDRSYTSWLRHRATTDSPSDPRTPFLTWGYAATLRPWLTAEARDAVAAGLCDASTWCEPLAPRKGRHLELAGIVESAQLVRAIADLMAPLGVGVFAPLLDDRVVEAIGRIDVTDRVHPRRYKPVLQEAMRGLLPDRVLTRTTKGLGSLDESLGRERHRRDLVELWSPSCLGRHGLVDDSRLRDLCANPEAPELADGAMFSSIATELWLRSLEQGRPSFVERLFDQEGQCSGYNCERG